jgi:UDP-glucose 4-epimerase
LKAVVNVSRGGGSGMDQVKKAFKGKKVLITGGLGFIGSNLAIKLVDLGANVTLMDAMIPEYGGSLFNIEPIKDDVRINFSNICDEYSVNYLVEDKDYIFHLAGQVSHVMSLTNPFPDIEINIRGTTVLMEACKKCNRNVVIIRSGTRGQYGPATKLPVDEDAPTNPKGIYEVSNLTAEKIMKVYNDNFGIRCVLLRLTNIYGQRAQMKTHHYGVANWFIRLAIDGTTIKVFGDGQLKRDFLYIDDCVRALLMAAINKKAYSEIFNVGVDKASTFLELAEIIVEKTGGRWEFAPFSPERKAQEPGDFYSDITKIKRSIGWEPQIELEKGVGETIEYYRKYKKYYWQ